MKNYRVIQVGLGPLGSKIAQFIQARACATTVAAIDRKAELLGKDLGELTGGAPTGLHIRDDLGNAIRETRPDVAILTTVSDMLRITPQIEELVAMGIPVITTCEELSYPWDCAPDLAGRIDAAAKANSVAVVGTGVNPGFLMDSLPTFLTAVCQQVDFVQVNRFQDAKERRLPFQHKIGAGLSPEAFERRRLDGSLRHVGLTESMQFIAHHLGWKLARTEDIIEPVIAERVYSANGVTVPQGHARGVRQTGNGFDAAGNVRIKLVFQATIGEADSYDEIIIKGEPELTSRIPGGVNGDIATCAISINAIPRILQALPGLRTMADIPLVSYFT